MEKYPLHEKIFPLPPETAFQFPAMGGLWKNVYFYNHRFIHKLYVIP